MAQKIIIIGVGIIGAATAYHAQKSGAEVTVLDAGGPSATRASFGWINASFFLDADHFALRHDALAAYRALGAELDLPVDWCGCLCFENSGDAFDAQAVELAALGYAFEVIDRAGFTQIAPHVANPPERALHFAQEAAAESGALADALLSAAQASGTRVIQGVAATGFVMNGDRVTGVQTNAGSLLADQVVSAVGTATEALIGTVGVTVPLIKRPAVMLKTQAVAPILNHILVTEIGEVRQLPDGALLMPAAVSHQSDESDSLHGAIDAEADAALARLQDLLPEVALRWEQVTLAHRPMPADKLPVVGAVKEGLYVACMHSGITLGALMGEQIAAEVLHGPSNETAKRLAPYRPGRFA